LFATLWFLYYVGVQFIGVQFILLVV